MAFKPNNPICILLKKKHSIQERVKNYNLKYDFFFFKVLRGKEAFILFIYLFIYGCVGSSFLCEGFL